MDQGIAGQRFVAADIEEATAEIGHAATGLLHQKHSRGCVPGVQIEFPEGVVSATGDTAQIEGR